MNNSAFKPGDLVFELTTRGKVLLSKLGYMPLSDDCVSTAFACYNTHGINEQVQASRLFHATDENRGALATLYGENEVPVLPLYGSDLTRKLLKTQKYVLCKVSRYSDGHARELEDVRTICSTLNSGFIREDGEFAHHAVPIDFNGNEITEIEE